ncbi:hypothetical protein NQ176_g7566 [Zarea fungicola]|uniref:Uncharacterized protein n=1 Tax=Zarea fungicola TaxID=93591 RepID=A0ACC1MXX6_9HYPO|nr:hypothetical protein NQ176_g7566 [Lecanicillium fungicola]
MQGKTDAGIGLGNMIRGAFNSDEEYPSQVEDVPLPLFSRSSQVASSEHSEIPAGGEMQKSAEAESNGVEKDKARIAFMTLDMGDWIVDREVVVDPAEPSEVQRLAIKYLQRGLGIFSSKNRVLTAETCFERVTSSGTNKIYVVHETVGFRSRRPPTIRVVNQHRYDITVVVSKYKPQRRITAGGIQVSPSGAGVNIESEIYLLPATQKTLASEQQDPQRCSATFPLWTRGDGYGVITIFIGTGPDKILYIDNDQVEALAFTLQAKQASRDI